jgi:hypothetical protein
MGMVNVSVSLTDGSGTVRSTFTGSMGYYNFDDVLAGENYVMDAQKKNYSFVDAPRLLMVNDVMTDVNFQASP